MAGIGFVLRKLTRQDNLMGVLQGFAHSALAANGPWLFTVLALGGLSLYGASTGTSPELQAFRLIVIYNFSFSLVFTGPVAMVMTRLLADAIHEQNVEMAPGMMIGGLGFVLITQLPVTVAFYWLYADLEPLMCIAAIGNFLAVSAVWAVSVFLSALKDYRSITTAFAAGMGAAFGGGVALSDLAGASGMLFGFSFGLVLTLSMLIGKILAEYPYAVARPFGFLHGFKRYWMLALSGLVYNLAIWVDKWVMWFAPEGERLPSGLQSYRLYDSAMFLAYLSVTPALAMFMVVVETRFYEEYLRFYRALQRHATWEIIAANHRSLIRALSQGVRNLVVIQGAICLFVILLAPALFDWLSIDYLQMGMFRLGVFGSLFHVLVLVLFIVLAYFDFRGPVLCMQAVLLVTNAGFTYATLQFGFPYYGYGYFLSALVTFAVAYAVTFHYVGELPYQTMVRYNDSVRLSRA